MKKKKPIKKVKRPVEEKELRLFIDYTSTSRGGNVEDPNDRWSSRTPQYKEVFFKCLVREESPNKTKFFYDSVVVDEKVFNGSMGYLAVVRYTTGDTFGTSHGNWSIVGCYASYNEAQAGLQEAISKESNGYKPWEGYFETLEGTEVHPLPIS